MSDEVSQLLGKLRMKNLVEGNSERKLKVVLVGAGYVARTHVEILKSINQIEVIAVCDPEARKANLFKERWQIPRAYERVEDVLEEIYPDSAHILVPPSLHFPIAKALLDNGITVFVEKPIALSSKDTFYLIELAKRNRVRIGVNHNLLYHPLYLRVLEALGNYRIGKIQHVNVIWNMPLRHLQAGDYGNWMFQDSRNIVFEQGPHPFSMICDLIGPASTIHVLVTGKKELVRDRPPFYETWQISLECKKGTANMFMSFGREFPENRLRIIGEDGSLEIDLVRNTYQLHEKSLWPGFFDSLLDGIENSSRLMQVSVKNFFNYSASFFQLQERTDSFYVSMKKSIKSFYIALQNNEPLRCSGEDAINVIQCCEKSAAFVPETGSNGTVNAAKHYYPISRKEDILLIGGTGFIGRHLVQKLVNAGHYLRVMARNPDMLPNEINHPFVRVVQGDIRDAKSVSRAVEGISIVYYLAIGQGETWKEIEDIVVGGLRRVANICREQKIKRFHFTSSISALYLGDKCTINEATPIDQYPGKRGLYARAKIECEHLLMKMHHLDNFPVVIYRPAVVVGKWGRPYHGAIGFWVNDRHCIGWGRGLNPLPFVLAEDVACALVNAMEKEEILGKGFLLAGDVRISAKKYVELLGITLQRDIQYHPRPFFVLQSKEIIKWLIKKCIKRPNSEFPSYRDLKTRSLLSWLDCTETKEILNWNPTGDLETFIDHGIRCYNTLAR